MKSSLLLLLFLLLALPGLTVPKFKTDVLKEEQGVTKAGPGYKIEGDYLVFAPPFPASGNALMKSIATNYVARFKKDYATDGSSQKINAWYLEFHWSQEFADVDVVSLLISEESFSGGAHPSHSQEAVMVSPKTGKRLTLAQCFRPRSSWLPALSRYCIKELQTQENPDKEMIASGAAPKAENYRQVLPGATGLMVYFQEYQVGPYVAGPQQVNVPYSVVRDQILPGGPLNAFRKAP